MTDEAPRKVVRTLKLPRREDETDEQALGRLSITHSMDAAATVGGFLSPCFQTMDINALADELTARTKAVQGRDLASLESMLAAQAETLSSIFHATAQRAAFNLAAYPQAAEMYLRLAMKAQSQCRSTVQTLSDMKAPRPIAYVQQANIAAGHQQVNNGFLDATTREEMPSAPNGLLESSNVTRMDARATGKAGRGHQALEAVGVIDGATHRSRKSRRAP